MSICRLSSVTRPLAVSALGALSLGALTLAGCDAGADAPAAFPPDSAQIACDAPGVRALAEEMGDRQADVSLMGPDSTVQRAIREAYGPLVTPALLARWLADPSGAPGREVSSPWPDRMEVISVTADDGRCIVEGEVIHVTSTEATRGGVVSRVPVTLAVAVGDPPLITALHMHPEEPVGGSSAPDLDIAAAADLLDRYYSAIDVRAYRSAYGMWSGDGAASGQTYEEFAAGFAETEHTAVEIGDPGRVEAAAGSRYISFPVVVTATTMGGERQRFEGEYILRRAVVDGATPEQREWRIHSASMRRAQ